MPHTEASSSSRVGFRTCSRGVRWRGILPGMHMGWPVPTTGSRRS